jgi:2',3'-cyclic-nucleotide 2'-phosphodiesterase/3'-nucleotidase
LDRRHSFSTIRKLANGLKVGLVGIVTDHIKKWEGMEWQNLNIEDPFQAAARELAIIRDKCDITICVYHGGYETDASFSKILETSNENVGYGICRYLSFDILLTAHQHKEKLGENICGTHTLQLPAKAEKYAKIVINYDEETKTKEIISELLSVGNTPASSICQKLQPLEDKVQAWLNEKAGSFTTAPAPVESHFEAALRGSSVVNFFQQVVLEHMRPLHGDTILCCESLRRVLVSFGKEVTIRELLTAYPFLNDLVVLEVDGVILKEALERSAAYYTIDGTLSEDFQPFYYDFIAGLPGNELEYTFDIGEPLGSRVKVLKYREESLLDGNERKLKMCLNDFRASGAGGYDCYGELKPVCSYKDVDLFSLARKYFIDHSPVTLEVKTNLTVENKGVRL